MIFKKKNIFDILNEEDNDTNANDNTSTDANATSSTDNNDDTSSNNDNADDQNTDETEGGDINEDDDFDIDASLNDDSTGDDAEDTTDTSDTDSSSSSSISSDSTEEVNSANTNIFTSLTQEEQIIKIKELKRLFSNLYTSCDDLLEKINDLSPDEDTMPVISRLTSNMYTLKQNIGDYILYIFSNKSYIENDIAFNRYLTILKSITDIFNSIADKLEEKIENA